MRVIPPNVYRQRSLTRYRRGNEDNPFPGLRFNYSPQQNTNILFRITFAQKPARLAKPSRTDRAFPARATSVHTQDLTLIASARVELL